MVVRWLEKHDGTWLSFVNMSPGGLTLVFKAYRRGYARQITILTEYRAAHIH